MPAPQLDSDYLGLDDGGGEAASAVRAEFALWADTPVCDAGRGMDNFYQLQQLAFLSYLMNGGPHAPACRSIRPGERHAIVLLWLVETRPMPADGNRPDALRPNSRILEHRTAGVETGRARRTTW